jgi:proline-specific peptidase
VIHYDQLGNGNSTRLPDKGPDFWTVELFLEELDALLAHLGIKDRYAFLGQSWGGMLGAEHAVRRPAGLKALVIANSPANMKTWVEEANRLRRELPQDVQDTLTRHETAGNLTDPDYIAASRVFYDRHVCRVVLGRQRLHAPRHHGRGQYRLPQHEWPDRISRHRHDEGLDHRGPPPPHRGPNPADLGAI